MTEWRVIPYYEDYEISEFGDVRRRTTIGKAKRGDYVCPQINLLGYKHLALCKRGVRKHFLVHRIVALAFSLDRTENRNDVAHTDGDKNNNHHRNLRWVTHKENMEDMIRHGNSNRGSRNWTSKFSEEKISKIREEFAISGETFRAYSKKLGIAHTTLIAIIRGKSWKNVSEVAVSDKDIQAVEAAGIDLKPYYKTGKPSDRLTIR